MISGEATEPVQQWASPPHTLNLMQKEVHLWLIAADVRPGKLESLRSLLFPDEEERAQKLQHQDQQRRFIASRAALRLILSRYTNTPPVGLAFSYGRHGKPAVAELRENRTIHFNLSHSGPLSLVAVSEEEVGIDLELPRDDIPAVEIAERCFSASERSALSALPQAKQIEAFFRCWTRKESYIKARGEGLSFPLDRFSVSLDTCADADMLHSGVDPMESLHWSTFDLQIPGYIAALTTAGGCSSIRYWQWTY
jgi:4'-phosphopantetheinyl transferase